MFEADAEQSDTPAEPLHDRWGEQQSNYPFGPNAVIGAAFKAAGLPVPQQLPKAFPSQQVAPGPIIAAALKAAGLMQS